MIVWVADEKSGIIHRQPYSSDHLDIDIGPVHCTVHCTVLGVKNIFKKIYMAGVIDVVQ